MPSSLGPRKAALRRGRRWLENARNRSLNNRQADGLAPIAVFAFNRPDHLAATLAALAMNDLAGSSPLTVYCDGPRGPADVQACEEVRTLAHEARGFANVTVVVRETNLGCAASVIDGVSGIFKQAERVIVIEDDILTTPATLSYLNAALNRYAYAQTVFSISAWSPPAQLMKVPRSYRFNSYFIRRFHCWGWASWRDRWDLHDWSVPGYDTYRQNVSMRDSHSEGGGDLPAMLDAQIAGRIDSWAIRAEYTRFLAGQLTLYPRASYVRNIGMDGSGRHCGAYDPFVTQLKPLALGGEFPNAVYVDPTLARRFKAVYSPTRLVSLWRRLQSWK